MSVHLTRVKNRTADENVIRLIIIIITILLLSSLSTSSPSLSSILTRGQAMERDGGVEV
jgi:hypothetical protein